jgi:hypothetical protein
MSGTAISKSPAKSYYIYVLTRTVSFITIVL